MKCPKCDYEDMTFSLPADVCCPECGYEYKYKGKAGVMEDCLIEKNKLILYTHKSIVVYTDENGKVHQGLLFCFIDDTPIWSRPLL